MRRASRVAAAISVLCLTGAQSHPAPAVTVMVTEGTSMSVAVSPDRQQLVIDLQGSLWILAASGGTARRITDEYNDARQPTWSPDGRTIAFQGYRDGGYDIWAIGPDGAKQHQLTWGPYDDREPAYSPDGRWLAFSSDRSGSYDVWLLEITTGKLRQVTSDPGDDYMPTFSPDGSELAFIGTRNGALAVWAVNTSTGSERRLTSSSGRFDAPSWGPSGALVYHNTTQGESRLETEGRPLTGGENAFAFRAGWIANREIVYVSDGRIRRRSLDGGAARDVSFDATLRVTPATYTRRARDTRTTARQPARGLVGPAISPDGKNIAFVALGDLYTMPLGGVPRNITHDEALDADPAWSPDGRYIAWSTDRAGGTLLDLWLYDTQTGESRALTRESTSAMGAAWSRDGTRIAFLDVDAIWRGASLAVVDVATRKVTRVHESFFGPSAPTWSPNGARIMVTALQRYSARFREGTNQLLTVAVEGGGDTWYAPVEHLSIDSRVGAGPAWSPDGTRVAVIYEGQLALVPVAADGRPLGPPRRLTTEIAHQPTWTGDSRHILYQSNDRLRLLDVETGSARDIRVQLDYKPAIPTGRVTIHAGRLVDGLSDTPRANVDIMLVGNMIARVAAHAPANHVGEVINASGLTVMPGLIEYHTHLQKDFGANANKAYLAFGITTVRSPGSTPYEAIEDREAVASGARPGPRLFVTGYLMEWNRVYYKMAVAVSSTAHLELELQRAKALGFDLIKSYVRMPDLQQRRIVEFAHAMGVPASSHEVFPSSLSGIDGTEHTTGTSRRGYSPKAATLQRSYSDVSALFAASGMSLTPTLALSGGGMRRLIERDSSLLTDPRFMLYPPWLRPNSPTPLGAPPGAIDPAAGGRMVLQLMKAGTTIVAGTDTPNAATLHGELYSYVLAGMTPFEALRTATVNSARLLGLNAGAVEAGRLADLAIVDGNPLVDITAAANVRYTIANGRVFRTADLVPR